MMSWFKKRLESQPAANNSTPKQPEAMAEARQWYASVSGSGTIIVRQRPSLLLMKLPFRAAEATLELGLAKLREQGKAATQWLKGLGAVRVEFGEPHFVDQAEMDPATRARTVAAKAMMQRSARASSGGRELGVREVLTAFWDIAALSAEEALKLLDRLRFEAAEDVGASETAEESPQWASPEEQLREITSRLTQVPADDDSPKFLFVAQLGEEQLAKASFEAFAEARRNAERLARAAGLRLAGLPRVQFGVGMPANGRHDKLMERQRCASLLAGSSYDLCENEVVSDDPRSAEFTVSVNVYYAVEEISQIGTATKAVDNFPL